MGIKHTSAFKLAGHDEGAYCSGHGTTANTPEELVEADLVAIDKVLAFSAGFAKPKKVPLFHLASGLTPDEVSYEGYPPGSGHINAFLQTSQLYDWAVSPTIGGMGTSKAFRFNDGDAEKDIYGCVVKKWEALAEINKPVFQDVEFLTARQKHTGCSAITGSGIPAFSTATKVKSSALALTIDSLAIAGINISRFKYTVENTFVEDDAGYTLTSGYIVNPALLERTHIFEIDYVEPSTNTWFTDEMNTSIQIISATLNLSIFTLTCSNFDCRLTNQSELEDRGIIRRKAEFHEGVSATVVKS